MDKTIPTDDCGFPICDVEGLSGLYLYPQGYTSYDNNTSDKEQDEYNDEHINFDKLKNDELEEIFKRKQESKTPQDFKCNNCFNMWKCAWCYHGFCDDIMSPYKLEGKPQFWSINDVDPESHCLTDVVFFRGQEINVTLEVVPTIVVVKTTKKK